VIFLIPKAFKNFNPAQLTVSSKIFPRYDTVRQRDKNVVMDR